MTAMAVPYAVRLEVNGYHTPGRSRAVTRAV
jgi:hypothetical protein